MEQSNKEILKQIFSENLKYYMGVAGETKASLAAITGYSYSTVSDWVDGKKYPRMDKVQALADHYGVLKSALTEKREQPTIRLSFPPNAIPYEYNHLAPVLGRIPAGYPVLADDVILGYEPVNVPNPEECFWLVVNGESMIDAGIEPGDHVLIRRQSDADDGKIIACRINSDEATLKRIHRQGDSVILYPANAKYQPIIVPQSDFDEGLASVIGVVIQLSRGF